jgi:monovalent cation:H+ antiporter-2, CPA2 family
MISGGPSSADARQWPPAKFERVSVLGQIAEFSFILAGLGVGLGILPPEGRDLILAGAILSILINPFLFTAVERGRVQLAPLPSTSLALQPDHPPPPAPLPVMALRNHDVIVGYGRWAHSTVAASRMQGGNWWCSARPMQ